MNTAGTTIAGNGPQPNETRDLPGDGTHARINVLPDPQQRLETEFEEFASAITHAFRSPLWIMASFLQFTLDDDDPAFPELRKSLAQLDNAQKALHNITRNIEEVVKVCRHQMHKEQLNLSDIVTSLAPEFERKYGDRHVDVRIEPHVAAFGDSYLLRDALHRLMSNAWKYTAPVDHAVIEFGTSRGTYPANSAHPQDAYYVRDNGVGFDPALSSKLFTPFGRLHAEKQFSADGMGLAIVQRTIHRHGGAIRGFGHPGTGAQFVFSLPNPTRN